MESDGVAVKYVVFDSAYPPTPATRPKATACLAYFGGDTPHVWTRVEIARQHPYKVVPVFVRSNPGRQARADATAMIAQLTALRVPKGVLTMLDIETAVNPTYVTQYGMRLMTAGYSVAVYGSKDNLFENPRLNGYWVSDPGAKSIDSRCIATQYFLGEGYDLSWLDTTIPLWNGIGVPDQETCTVTLPVLRERPGPDEAVRALQALLTLRGHRVTLDAVFGAQTLAAVREVQGAIRETSGVVDAPTWAYLIDGSIK